MPHRQPDSHSDRHAYRHCAHAAVVHRGMGDKGHPRRRQAAGELGIYIHRIGCLRGHPAVRADGPVRLEHQYGARYIRRCRARARPHPRRTWHGDRGRQCRLCRLHRHHHRLGVGFHQGRRAGNDPARSHAEVLGRRRRRQLGAGHADPAERPDDHLRGDRQFIDRRSVQGASCWPSRSASPFP